MMTSDLSRIIIVAALVVNLVMCRKTVHVVLLLREKEPNHSARLLLTTHSHYDCKVVFIYFLEFIFRKKRVRKNERRKRSMCNRDLLSVVNSDDGVIRIEVTRL